MTATLGPYPGSKAAGGAAERIAGLFPKHEVYIECFLGHGAVLRRKTPADVNIGVDVDPAVCSRWSRLELRHVKVRCEDVISYLTVRANRWGREAMIYLDPPYLEETRTRLFYDYEFASPAEHVRLLGLIRCLDVNVAISGYWSKLYDDLLHDWRRVEFQAMTRGGLRTECVWLNFPEPAVYHDPMLANVGFRERERVKRRVQRWTRRIQAMTQAERQCVYEAIRRHSDAAAIAADGEEDQLDGGGEGIPTEAHHADVAQR